MRLLTVALGLFFFCLGWALSAVSAVSYRETSALSALALCGGIVFLGSEARKLRGWKRAALLLVIVFAAILIAADIDTFIRSES